MHRRRLLAPECSTAEIVGYERRGLQSFRISVAHKFHEGTVRISKIDRCAWPSGTKPLQGALLDHDPVTFEMGDRPLDRAKPLKTEVAVARLHWQPCHFRRLYTGAMDIELLVAKPISVASRPCDQFSADNFAVKPVRSLPVGDMNYAVIEPSGHCHRITLSFASIAHVRAPMTASSRSRACRAASFRARAQSRSSHVLFR